MNHPIKQPIVNSRTFSSRSSSNFLDKSLSGSFEDPYNALLTRKPSFHSKNTPFSSQKTGYTLFKIDPHLIEQYLEKYKAANLYYRDEEFSQQADNFLTKVAMDRKIPDEYRARFPVYQILVSISKIFMLNEFEIVAFACLIDNCPWNIDEILSFDEANYLNEFPSNFGLEIGVECKRFIIYLLFIAFTLKQYLGEKNEIDYIQAYCETICQNFQMLFNRWVKAASNMRFQYSLPEINSKFRYLAKRDLQGHQSSVKDYNMMVDEIMGLTGTYTTRTKDMKPIGHPEPFFEQTKQFKPQKTQVFENNFFQQPPIHIPETKPFQGTSIPFPEERGLSRSGTFDFFESGPGFRMPSFLQNISRQPSLKNTSSLLRRQTSIDMMGDTMGNKPRTGEESNRVPNLQTQPSFLREFSMSGWAKPDLQTSFSSIFKQEDIGNNAGGAGSTGNINLPMLSKKASVVSQEPDDLPTLSRFQSNLSFLYEKNN